MEDAAYKGKIAAVLSTTSCFAPRRPDKVDEIARLCAEHDVAHVVNNAYGLQCPGICRLINRAVAVGRVDYVVSSTDKNFLVPVGGAVVASPDGTKVELVSKMYPGRASISPILDLFITLLSLGVAGLKGILAERSRLLPLLVSRLEAVARKHGERILVSPYNTISVGFSLRTLAGQLPETDAKNELSFLGSMLFQRCVSGTRIIPQGASKTIGGHTFDGWGASAIGYGHPYLTAACAIGLTEGELDVFVDRMDRVLTDFRKKRKLPSPSAPPASPPQAAGEEGVGKGHGKTGDVSMEALAAHWVHALSQKRW
jgi:O-phospho-L-seryl-tRNASec:L-selenocysteinyl-tRNA synthase